ncbi:MAG: phosphodiester glycosidase family protein [Solirubrobacterales bacterium]|nr:phosphodiester glycosidase family protein [Solirubrobacterales bacterium]
MRRGTAIRSYEERILAYERALAAPQAAPRHRSPERSDPGSPDPRHRAPDPRHRSPERPDPGSPDPRHRSPERSDPGSPDPRHRAPTPRHRAPTPRHRAPDPRRRATSPIRFRVRRIAALVTLLLVADVFASFAEAMLRPSNVGPGVRVVEWLRDNGAAGLVSDVEAIYYSLNAPSTGGAALRALPKVGTAGSSSARGYAPPPIPPVIEPALPGEGAWRGTGPLVAGAPPVLVTTFRPDASYPQLVAGVAWVDTSRASLALYPGRYEPPGGGGQAAEVPTSLQPRLLATFNSGFKLEDSGGGFVVGSRIYAPLRDGQATLIAYRDGRVDVQLWTGGPAPGGDVVLARQNLPLIVSGGRLATNLTDGPEWGATLGNAVRVWRSAVGVDARGNLLYAAADLQTASSIARILQRAGAVRAMELDINAEWVTFNFYGGWSAAAPQKLLPDMTRDATRYLTPDDRDFFAVYARVR